MSDHRGTSDGSRVVVVGSINMDVVASTSRHPAIGETVLGTDLRFVPGGKGANQAVAAARLGAPTAMTGRVGADAFGDSLLEFLAGEAVDVNGVTRTADAATGTALIVVDDRSENSIVVVPGANATLCRADVAGAGPPGVAGVGRGDVVVVQFEIPIPVAEEAVALGRRRGACTIVNAAPAIAVPARLLGLADVIVVNAIELAGLTGAPVPSGSDAAADLALGLGGRSDQMVIVTLGAAGAVAVIGGEQVRVPGRPVRAVDSTGAGDCFVGALAAALCAGSDLTGSVRFANTAASIAVQRFGAGTGMPSSAEIRAALAGRP